MSSESGGEGPEKPEKQARQGAEVGRGKTRPPVPEALDRRFRSLGRSGSDAYLGAWEAVIALVLGAVGGYYADQWLDTAPIGQIMGLVLGFAAMVIRLIRLRPEEPIEAEPNPTNDPEELGTFDLYNDQDTDPDDDRHQPGPDSQRDPQPHDTRDGRSR